MAERLLVNPDQSETNAVSAQVFSFDLLPDWYEDWLIIERERYRQLRLHALESLCGRLALAGRYGEAVVAGLEAVSGEPLRESAHRAVITAYLLEGNLVEADRQARWYRNLLHEELGIQPSRQFEELVRRLSSAPTYG